jgi:hypothetical protein
MIACIFEHIQWRSALNDFIAHGYLRRLQAAAQRRADDRFDGGRAVDGDLVRLNENRTGLAQIARLGPTL